MPFDPVTMRERQQRTNASETPAILGLSPHTSLIDVYESKVGTGLPQGENQDQNIDLLRGTYLEPACIKIFERMYGVQVQTGLGSVQLPGSTVPIYASPDGRVDMQGETYNVEVKCPRFVKQSDWCDGDWPYDLAVPAYVLPQVMTQMACTGLRKSIVMALLGDELRVMVVEYDAAFWADMHKVIEHFWTQHVVPRVPPPPDASEGYARHLGRLHPRVRREELITASPAAIDAAKHLALAAAQLKQAEEIKEQARNDLKALIGDAQGIDFGSAGKVTWKNNNPTHAVDYQAILTDYGITPTAGDLARRTITKPGARVFRGAGLKGHNL